MLYSGLVKPEQNSTISRGIAEGAGLMQYERTAETSVNVLASQILVEANRSASSKILN